MRALEGKVAFVTGGSRGIGAAVARSLTDAGALPIACDPRGRAAVAAAADRVAHELGGIDIVVPNAGVASYGAFLSLSGEDVDEMVLLAVTRLRGLRLLEIRHAPDDGVLMGVS